MPVHRIEVEAVIDAPAAVADAIIADYRDGHPHILRRPPFVSRDVEAGGVGAGTAIRFRMRMLGATQEMWASVKEPNPGRVLAESDASGDVVTTFTVDPADGGRKAPVAIATDVRVRGGPLGRLQRSLLTGPLRPVHVREIEPLGAVAAARAAEM